MSNKRTAFDYVYEYVVNYGLIPVQATLTGAIVGFGGGLLFDQEPSLNLIGLCCTIPPLLVTWIIHYGLHKFHIENETLNVIQYRRKDDRRSDWKFNVHMLIGFVLCVISFIFASMVSYPRL